MNSRRKGTIEHRGRKWFLKVTVDAIDHATGEVTPERKRIELGTTTELRTLAAARAAGDAWLARQANQTLQPGPKIKAAAYFEEFLRRTVSLWRKSSRKLYRSIIRHHLIPAFRGTLPEVTSLTIRELLAKLVQGGKHRRNTIANVRSVALRVMRQAVTDGYAAHKIDPKSVRLPSDTEVKREQRWMTAAETQAVIDASAFPWLAAWVIAGRMGLRIGEVLGLTWDHVDLVAKTLRVRLSAVLGEMQPPKTKTSIADLPIPDDVADVLIAYSLVWVKNKAGLLFATSRGTPYRADDVRRRHLQPLLRELGIPRAGFHAFRHGLPRDLLEAGISPAVVQRILRHASLQMTAAYTHTAADDLRAAVKAGTARRATTKRTQNPAGVSQSVPS